MLEANIKAFAGTYGDILEVNIKAFAPRVLPCLVGPAVRVLSAITTTKDPDVPRRWQWRRQRVLLYIFFVFRKPVSKAAFPHQGLEIETMALLHGDAGTGASKIE